MTKRRYLERPPANGGFGKAFFIAFAEVHRNLERPPAKVYPILKGFAEVAEVAEVDPHFQKNRGR
jgi:hypothetical protein